MKSYQLDVVVTRGDLVESCHRVHAAVVDRSGRLIAASRDAGLVSFWRSCAKPFQVMSLLESGGFDELGWGDDELALSCASHGGEPEHVKIAGRMLDAIDMEEGDLVCGPHEPLSPRGAKIVRESGQRPTRLHNNCSGKHAAMLARARTMGWNSFGYERREHPVQAAAMESVAHWSGVPLERIDVAVDGCGVVVFGFDLESQARAFARLADAAERGEEIPERIVNAMRSRPFLIGGTERFDSVLIEESGGAVISKVGAEGVHAVTVPDAGLGIAVKVEDGAQRAQYPAVLRLLQHLDVLPARLPPRLDEFLRRPIRNTRGESVGEVRTEH